MLQSNERLDSSDWSKSFKWISSLSYLMAYSERGLRKTLVCAFEFAYLVENLYSLVWKVMVEITDLLWEKNTVGWQKSTAEKKIEWSPIPDNGARNAYSAVLAQWYIV